MGVWLNGDVKVLLIMVIILRFLLSFVNFFRLVRILVGLYGVL